MRSNASNALYQPLLHLLDEMQEFYELAGTMDLPKAAPQPSHHAWELNPGDTVVFLAPSKAEDRQHYATLAATMQQWGLNVVKPEDLTAEKDYYGWPNTPERRATHLIDVLKNPGIKAIFAVEGGEGASEVVELLKKREKELDALPKRAIPLIGYSDITQLHLYLGQKGLVSPVQGPTVRFMVEREGMNDAEKQVVARNQEALRSFLLDKEEKLPAITLMPINEAARQTSHVKGTLVGGADISISMADQSSHQLKMGGYSGQILFLEGRSSASLRYALSKLQQRKQLGGVDAIVLGRYYDNQQYTGDIRQAYVQELQQTLQEMGITKPVYFGVPTGHPYHQAFASPIIPVPMHVQAEITAAGDMAVLQADRFRDIRESTASREQKKPVRQPKAPSADVAGQSPIVVLPVPVNELHLPDTSAVMEKDLCGKKVVLQFGEHADIPMLHMALMEIVGAEKLNGAQSVLIASSQPVPQETQNWLRDFQQRHLPQVPVELVYMQNACMLKHVSCQPCNGNLPGKSA